MAGLPYSSFPLAIHHPVEWTFMNSKSCVCVFVGPATWAMATSKPDILMVLLSKLIQEGDKLYKVAHISILMRFDLIDSISIWFDIPKFFLKEFLLFLSSKVKWGKPLTPISQLSRSFQETSWRRSNSSGCVCCSTCHAAAARWTWGFFLHTHTHTHAENILLVILKQISSRKLYFSIDISLIFLTGL